MKMVVTITIDKTETRLPEPAHIYLIYRPVPAPRLSTTARPVRASPAPTSLSVVVLVVLFVWVSRRVLLALQQVLISRNIIRVVKFNRQSVGQVVHIRVRAHAVLESPFVLERLGPPHRRPRTRCTSDSVHLHVIFLSSWRPVVLPLVIASHQLCLTLPVVVVMVVLSASRSPSPSARLSRSASRTLLDLFRLLRLLALLVSCPAAASHSAARRRLYDASATLSCAPARLC